MSIYVIPSEIEAEAMQATPHIELIAQIMSSVAPKNEREWAASREIERLRAQVETLEWQLTMESIDTTCHCAAKSAADCGCPGAVWPEDTLRSENGRLREALHTAREGLAHIKAVARLHAEGADTALEGRS